MGHITLFFAGRYTLRQDFIAEINDYGALTLMDLNARLWVWIEQIYHQRVHAGLVASGKQHTPIARWREDLAKIRPLGNLASQLDDYFYHRVKRTVKKDGTVSYQGQCFEVPYELSGQSIYLVVDPVPKTPKWVESLTYERLGAVHLLDKQANCQRKRQRPNPSESAVIDSEQETVVDILYDKVCDELNSTLPNT